MIYDTYDLATEGKCPALSPLSELWKQRQIALHDKQINSGTHGRRGKITLRWDLI